MSKKVLKIRFGLTEQKLIICLTKKAYSKEMKKLGCIDSVNAGGVTTNMHIPGKHNLYIVGMNENILKDNDMSDYERVSQYKALLVHELNHVVTYHMNYFRFDCDEYRSTLLQYLYIDTIRFVDHFLEDLGEKKNEK